MKWMFIYQLAEYHQSILIHKILTTKSPDYLYTNITNNNNQATRRPGNIRFKPWNKQSSKNTFTFNPVIKYQNLPEEIKQIQSIKKFKKHLKKHLTHTVSYWIGNNYHNQLPVNPRVAAGIASMDQVSSGVQSTDGQLTVDGQIRVDGSQGTSTSDNIIHSLRPPDSTTSQF